MERGAVLRTALLLALLLLAIRTVVVVAQSAPSDVLFYVYGMSTCPHCRVLHDFLRENYPNNFFFCDVYTSTECRDYFAKYLEATGLPGYVPQTIVVKNMSYVLAIVIGEVTNTAFFDSLTKLEPSLEVPLYEGTALVGYLRLVNMSVHRLLIQLLYIPPSPGGQQSTQGNQVPSNATKVPRPKGEGPVSLVAYLVPLALSDSVNPCAIAIYAVLLASVVAVSVRRAVATGLLFILGVFAGYTALGLATSYGFSLIAISHEVVLAVLIAFGAFLLLRAFTDRGECKVCREESSAGRIQTFLSGFVEKSRRLPLFSFLLGLLVSLTLLPCSMGPYIVFLATLREAGVSPLPYIVLYNVLFGVPLYIVLVALVICRRQVNLERYKKWVYFASGLALIVLAIAGFM